MFSANRKKNITRFIKKLSNCVVKLSNATSKCLKKGLKKILQRRTRPFLNTTACQGGVGRIGS